MVVVAVDIKKEWQSMSNDFDYDALKAKIKDRAEEYITNEAKCGRCSESQYFKAPYFKRSK